MIEYFSNKYTWEEVKAILLHVESSTSHLSEWKMIFLESIDIYQGNEHNRKMFKGKQVDEEDEGEEKEDMESQDLAL